MTRGLGTGVLLAAALATGAASADAADRGDWPQLWGPSGDGRAATGVALPRGEVLKGREVWRRPIGSGFSGISVVDGRGYTGLSDGTKDYAVAFDTATGRELWRTALGETYRGHTGSKDGPISTPTVEGGRVHLLGPHGLLVALDARDGRILWKKDLVAEFGAAKPFYGFGTSPLVTGGRVILQAGGEKAHHLVALDAATGAVAWSAHHAGGAGYVTPVLATIHGTPQVVTVSADKVLAVRPSDGGLLWSTPRPTEGEPSRPPLVLPDGRLLVHSWNDVALLSVAPADGGYKVTEVWRSPRLKNSYSPTVFHDGHLFGFSGAYLVCLDPATGEPKWRQKVYGGNLILVDGHLVMLGESSGDLRIAEASPAGYKEKLKMPIFNAGATSFTGPSWARGRLYLRNVEEIVALEIGS